MKFGIINITSFCNHNCIFCSEGNMHNNPNHIKYNKVIQLLNKLKNDGVEGVNFMGGECTMNPNLVNILDYCNNNFKFISIATNGIMFLNYVYARKILSKITSFEFSWHSNNKEIFNILSGKDTFIIFQKSLTNISKILEERKNLGIVINHVINKFNYKDLEGFVKVVINKIPFSDNRIIAFKAISIVGYSIKNIGILSISPEKVFPYLIKAIEYCIKNKVYVQIEGFPPCFFKDFLDSQYFVINELDNESLYLLNKIDISIVDFNNIQNYLKNDLFNNKIYLMGDINLNKKILNKCKSCLIRKICHREILLGEDSNLLSDEIIDYIGTYISKENINSNLIKRKLFLKNILKGNILR